jgi:predicted esterase
VDRGAVFWTDFLYDDHGAIGVPESLPVGALTPARGTYRYPDGPAAHNGADIFRAAVGLTGTDSWWRVDWNTLLDAGVPIAAFAIDLDPARPGAAEWPAGAGVRSPGIDQVVLLSGTGAWLIDAVTGQRVPLHDHRVDMAARSFVVRLPRTLLDPSGTWIVRLVSGLANHAGDGFEPVPEERGAKAGQPAVYNVAFRTHLQEPPALNFWMDRAQAEALTAGDVSAFALEVHWPDLAAGVSTPEPRPTGFTNRWYVSSIELGQGAAAHPVNVPRPQYLGRVQPYGINVPAGYRDGSAAPLTFLLHSLGTQHNQFAAIDPKFVHQASDLRGSICVTPLGRGASGWYFDEAELDVWEVWARVREAYTVDPDRTVVSGYSMGGYGAYKLGLAYPSVFAAAVPIAGPPTCGVRLWPDASLPPDFNFRSRCARDGESFPLLANARWLPFVIAHGVLDELVPVFGVIEQVVELDRLGYRYRFELYPLEDHIGYAVKDGFSSAAAHMGVGLRQGDPGHITFAWYPGLVRNDLGIGPHRVWWVSSLVGTSRIAEVDAQSLALPDPSVTTDLHGSLLFPGDPTPGLVATQSWSLGPPPARSPVIDLRLRAVTSLTIDIRRAGFAPGEAGTVQVATDGATTLALDSLPSGTPVRLDGVPVGSVVDIPKGQHVITFG